MPPGLGILEHMGQVSCPNDEKVGQMQQNSECTIFKIQILHGKSLLNVLEVDSALRLVNT